MTPPDPRDTATMAEANLTAHSTSQARPRPASSKMVRREGRGGRAWPEPQRDHCGGELHSAPYQPSEAKGCLPQPEGRGGKAWPEAL